MTPKHLIMGAASLALSLTVVALAAANLNGGHTTLAQLGTTQPTYSYASIHFGMDDSTLSGDAYLGSSTLGSGASVGVCHNVEVESYASSAAYMDEKVCGSVKLASSKKDGSMTLTLSREVVGCVVYCVGWKGKQCAVSANGQEPLAVASDDLVTGSSGSAHVTYAPYAFSFDATRTVTVTAAKNKQIVIGDIPLRVAN